MLDLAFERSHRVLLARFHGIFEPADLRRLDEAVRDLVREQGPVRGLLDFTDVTLVAVPETLLRARSRLPQISPGQMRAIVAPQDEVFALATACGARQRDFGNVRPLVVRTLDEAYEALGLEQPHFMALSP
jgi:hypothetical protein